MDKDALDLIAATVIARNPNHHSGKQYADAIDAALGANGYVVVPRHLLDELLDHTTRLPVPSDDFDLLRAARAAVVEAVGPTREDKERECICPPATSTTVAEHGYASGGVSTRYGCPKHTYEVRNEAVGLTT